jgi:hypothetical protein
MSSAIGALRLTSDPLERRFQFVGRVTANPVQMDKQAGRVLAFGTFRLDTGGQANFVQDRT